MSANLPGRNAPATVVIIDDNVDGAVALAKLLHLYGLSVVDVQYNGADGLASVLALRPDIVMLDIAMPKMDGYSVARRIRKQAVKQPLLIATTAFDAKGDLADCHDAGFDVHLAKPLDISRLSHLADYVSEGASSQ